jgi:hypothetical protein
LAAENQPIARLHLRKLIGQASASVEAPSPAEKRVSARVAAPRPLGALPAVRDRRFDVPRLELVPEIVVNLCAMTRYCAAQSTRAIAKKRLILLENTPTAKLRGERPRLLRCMIINDGATECYRLIALSSKYRPGRSSRMYSSVFQYDMDDRKMERLKAVIYDHIQRCIRSGKPTKEFPGWLLYYGKWKFCNVQCLNVEKCLDELIWKRSELTGKYIGCPFWSVEAKAFFDNELNRLSSSYRDLVSLRAACNLAECLKSRKLGGRRLIHEHVFPKKYLIPLLSRLGSSVNRKIVEEKMERLSVGCVLLESEHPKHDRVYADNPWRRYKDIALAYNPRWPDDHCRMIKEAGLRIQT